MNEYDEALARLREATEALYKAKTEVEHLAAQTAFEWAVLAYRRAKKARKEQ